MKSGLFFVLLSRVLYSDENHHVHLIPIQLDRLRLEYWLHL